MVKIQVNSNGKAFMTTNNKVLLGKDLGTKSITSNGTYAASSDSLDGYSSVTVNVSGGGGVGIPREVSQQGVYQIPASSFTFSLPSNATDLGDNALERAFGDCSSLTTVSFPELTTISGDYALGSAFYNCTALTSVSFPALTTISGNGALSSAFDACENLTSVSFPALTSQSFGEFDNQFDEMLGSCENVTVHFPSNLQSVIGDWQSVIDGFDGTDTTILFDLTATE